MKLLIDIGNTRTKSAVADAAEWLAFPPIVNSDVQNADLWKTIQRVDSVWIASVASDATTDIVSAAVRQRFGITPQFARSSATACGVRNAYASPERLGIDRFLSLIAAHAVERQDAVVASCGTALALDAIDRSGQHFGGLIAPSPRLMQNALRNETARLSEAVDADIAEIATSTDAAITSGTWLAAAALVERFVKQTSIRLNRIPRLWLTGGGAQRLSALIGPGHRVEPDLVLRGLALFAEAQAQRLG